MASASFRGDLSGLVFSSATFRGVKAKGFADVFLGTDKRSDELGPAIMLYVADHPRKTGVANVGEDGLHSSGAGPVLEQVHPFILGDGLRKAGYRHWGKFP